MLFTKKNSTILILLLVIIFIIFLIYSSYDHTPIIQEGVKNNKLTKAFKSIGKGTTKVFNTLGKGVQQLSRDVGLGGLERGVEKVGAGALGLLTGGSFRHRNKRRPPPPEQPRVMDGYKYKGCWSASLESQLNQAEGESDMQKCIQTAKDNQHNTSVLNGNVCKTGNIQDSNMQLIDEKNNVDPDCNIYGTTNSAKLVYSSYVAPPPEKLYDYSYKGCWTATSDPATNPLPVYLRQATSMNDCVFEGLKQGYNTVALQNGNQCWAGNKSQYFKDDYKALGPVNSTDPYACDISDPGPTTAIVYSILNEPVITPMNGYRYGGCWKDKDKSPYLPNKIEVNGEDGNPKPLTLEECLAAAQGYNSVAYKSGGKCYAGNQGSDGIDYKKGGEIPNNDENCDVGGPGPNTSIIYTKYGPPQEKTINGYDYKGCWKNDEKYPAMLYPVGPGFTLDTCLKAAKSGRYDTAALQNQNECVLSNQGVGISDYKMYGQISDNNSPICNADYPGYETAVVYSTWNSPYTPDVPDVNTPIIESRIIDKIGIGGGDNVAPSEINGYTFKGIWNESVDRAVPIYLGSNTLEKCLETAANNGYSTVSFQNKDQCWAGNNPNYKRYGKPSASSIKNPNMTPAVIYSTGSDPSPHINCSIPKENFEPMNEINTQNTNIPQPPYTIPQTTTVVFDPIPNTNTVITYSQTPISTSQTSNPTNLQSTSNMNQDEKSEVHKKWLPNTPFVYENKNDDSSSASSSSSSSSAKRFPGSMFTNTDIINNRYGSSATESGLESFANINKKYGREGIESLSPPSTEIPGAFVPKTAIVPPVCPSIPPVIIKTDCSVCKTNGGTQEGGSNGTSSSSGKNAVTTQMTNNFTNTNSINGTQDMYGSSCNNAGRSYDNIPQPYLPSFSGFGM
jgi:hypothetical protein